MKEKTEVLIAILASLLLSITIPIIFDGVIFRWILIVGVSLAILIALAGIVLALVLDFLALNPQMKTTYQPYSQSQETLERLRVTIREVDHLIEVILRDNRVQQVIVV